MRLEKNSSGTYSVIIKTEHGERKLTTRSKDKKEAQRIVKDSKIRELEAAAKATRLTHAAVSQLTNGRKITMTGLIPEYTAWMRSVGMAEQSIDSAMRVLLAWTKDAGVMAFPPALVTDQHISKWINGAGEQKRTTRLRNLSVIASLFKFASVKGYVSGNPAGLVRVDLSKLTHEQKEKQVRRPITEAEFDVLLEGCKELVEPTFWRMAIMLGYFAGLRISDVCTLEWKSIESPNKIVLWTKKTDARVEVPAHPRLAAELSKLQRGGRSLYVWPEAAKRIQDVNKRSYYSKTFERLAERCDLVDVSFHCLRHTYATDMARRGVPTPHISQFVGHTSASTTEGYIHRH